jgi:hypothetical protein
MSFHPELLFDYVEAIVKRMPPPRGVMVAGPFFPPDRMDDILVIAKCGNKRTVYRSIKCHWLTRGANRSFTYVRTSLDRLYRDAIKESELKPDGREVRESH